MYSYILLLSVNILPSAKALSNSSNKNIKPRVSSVKRALFETDETSNHGK